MHDAAHNSPPDEGWRAISYPSEFRAEEDDRPPRLVGHFARYGVPNEIDSVSEGQFMESIAPGAFNRSFKNNRDRIRVLFQHGRDPNIGEQPIARITDLRSDKIGPYYEAELLEGVPPLVMDGLRKGVYGVSYRFKVTDQGWDHSPGKSPANPKGLPAREIREAIVYEFGPVTFPADAGADVAVRSLTDQMAPSPTPEPVAPSPEPAAVPHLVDEARDEPVTIAATITKERSTVEYVTRDEKSSRVTELKAALARQAIEYPGVLPNDAQATWDSDTSELDTLQRDIAAWDTRQAKLAAYAQDPNKVERSYEPVASFGRKTESDIYDPAVAEPFRYRSTDQWAGAQRDNAMRIVEATTFVGKGHIDQERAREDVQNVLDNLDTRDKQAARRIAVTQAPIYRRAFNKLAAGQSLTAEEERGTSMVVTTDGNGGFAVPFAFDPTWLHTGAWTNVNGIRANARVVQIVGTDTWQGTTVGVVTATRGAESTDQAEQGPTLTRPEILAGRVSAFVSYSIEMGMDVPGLGPELASLIAEAKDNEEESSLTIGVGGANALLGIAPVHGTSGMYTHINMLTDHTLVAGDAYAMEAALPIRHRQGAAWFMARPMIRSFQALETTNGQLFGGLNYSSVGYPQNSIVGATGLELLRYPIVETPSMPSDYVTAANNLFLVACLANLKSSYVIVDRVGMSVEFVPHLFHADGKLPIGARGLYALWRNGAEVVNVDGGRLLSSTAA